MKNVGKLAMEVTSDRYGSLFKFVPSFEGAADDLRHGLGQMSAHICHALDFACIPLPNGEVRPGQRWQAERQVPVMTGNEDVGLLARTSYVYRGVRTVNGRELAVIAVTGGLAGGPANLGGSVSGTILVDVAQGRVVKATATADSTFQAHVATEQGVEGLQVRFRLDLKLTRE